jgi:hypothetical protein
MRLFFALLFSMATFSTSGLDQAKGPELQIDTINRDVGRVSQGEIIKQIFAFTNKGAGVLEILNVEHS